MKLNLNFRSGASVALLGLLSLSQATPGRAAVTHDVNIQNFSFQPPTLNIPVGDSIRWVQQDQFVSHSSTSGSPPGTPNGLWDSGLLATGQTFTRMFNTAGTFPYYCVPHFTSMFASVTVESGANQAPSVEITNPTDGAALPVTNAVTIEATASDDGSVAQVEFFDGAASIGTSAAAPYRIAVNLSLGGHSLTAVATDNLGLSTTSAPVSITIRTVPIPNPIVEKIPKGAITIEIQTVADGMASPLGMTVPDDGSGRMFVYDQSGLVWIVDSSGRSSRPLLDVRSRLVRLGAYDERGLLGCAAHPNFAQHPLIYTYTSEPNGVAADFVTTLPPGATNNHQSIIAEWRLDPANSNQVDLASRREILRIDEPQANHNGGTMRFGPDGLLYVSLGDGGQADDEGNGHSVGGNAQDTTNILGSVVRIDVDARSSANGQYGVPADNPFVGLPGVDEIYAYGFRNPFSFSFDRSSGQLYLGDVGQNVLEEVDIVVKGGNYGWRIKEGNLFFDPNGAGAGYVTDRPVVPVPPDLIDPIAVYDHDEGLAVVGGYVYRGGAIPALQGRYLMADWGTFNAPSGRLFYLDASNNVKEFHLGVDDRPLGLWVKGWGEDANGELYVFASRVLGPAGNTGKMLKIIPPPEPIAFTTAQPSTTNLAASWTGGHGPFALQNKANLTDPAWGNQVFSATRDALAPADNLAGFFRAADAAHVGGSVPLTAWISGAMERPTPIPGNGSGSGTFLLDDDTLYFNIRYEGLSGVASGAHIHGPADAASSAGVQIDLSPFNGGAFGSNGAVSGSVVLTPAQKAMVLAGRSYVNFHTANNQGGEIRGQIAPVMMQASLNGSNERPTPLVNSGNGLGTFALVGNQLSLNVTYRDLTGTATASHIHGPASAAQFANVLVDLAPFNGGAFGSSGSLEGTLTLTPSQLALVVDGLTYVNVHTVENGGGEIRGQLLAQSTAIPLTAWMSGLMERPTPITNNASGTGIFSLEGTTLTFSIKYKDLSGTATAAHIHGPSTAGGSAGVLINLAPYNGGAFGTSGTLAGQIQLTPAQRDLILSGQTYANVHTANNQGGEIRGQIAAVGMMASLSGVNELPNPTVTSGSGSATLALVGNKVTFNVTYGGLTGPATASHFHGPAGTLATAGVIVDLLPFNGGAFGVSGTLTGTATFTPPQLAALIDGLTYLNVHTATNGGGEIRGQVTR